MQHKQQLCATSTAIHRFDTSRSLFQEYLNILEKALLSLTRQHERQRTGKLDGEVFGGFSFLHSKLSFDASTDALDL
jgi:hypothetical protein